jgi:[ribosomal protein S5]-alanine N-acetyltransferase
MTMAPITTPRLDLVPAGLAALDAELTSHAELAAVLGAEVPEGWPPGEYDLSAIRYFRDHLAADPDAANWLSWYAMLRPVGTERPTLVAAAGFFGPPDGVGSVEIGYSVVPAFTGQGLATEIVRALVDHAFATGRVRRIVAHTAIRNSGSARVLDHAGFAFVGPGKDEGTVEYVIVYPPQEKR